MQKTTAGHKVRVLNNLIRRNFDNMTEIKEADRLTGMQGWIIGYLYEHSEEDIFQKDFESRFNIRRSTVTGMLQLMEKNDLIKRMSVESDARLKKIVLTEKAIEHHTRIQASINKFEKKLTENVSEEDLEVFNRVMDQMIQNIE